MSWLPNLVFGGAFFKKLPRWLGGRVALRRTAFSFRQAFSFGPIASKEKASSGEAPGNPQNSFLVSGNPCPGGQCRRLLGLNRTRFPEFYGSS